MSLYNMINGVNQATFFFLPMLGKHPEKYPRFRDCWIGKVENDTEKKDQFGIPLKKQVNLEKRLISIYTRTGGSNREGYIEEIKEMQNNPNYIEDYDDDFDCTFATFVFNCPKKFEKDYDLIKEGKIKETSKEYQNTLTKVFPKLKDKFKKMFK